MWDKLLHQAKILFLIDGAGALLTAFMLFGVLRTFSTYFGMPPDVLTLLSLIALGFCVYSLSCYLLAGPHWRPWLLGISIANLLYCCATLALVVYYYPQLTGLGIAYFMGEIAIICSLVFIEVWVLVKSRQKSS